MHLLIRHSWILFFLLATSASAETFYYVDPNWSGAQTGTPTTPWTSLNSSAWTTINTKLASDNVTVYFSANRTANSQIIIDRKNTSTFRLMLDGKSRVNDGSAQWAAAPSGSKFLISTDYPVSTKYPSLPLENSNITLQGFKIVAIDGQIIYWWGGSNITVQDCDLSSSPGATVGPGFYFGYKREEWTEEVPCVADGHHSCTSYHDIALRNNYIHDTFGEAVYIGGCAGFTVRDCQAHDRIFIENNEIYYAAHYGGEADFIDVKDANTNVVIRGNYIHGPFASYGRMGISIESGTLIENNFISGSGVAGIGLLSWYDLSNPVRANSVVRNNVIVQTGGNSNYSWSYGIIVASREHAGGDQFDGAQIYNNTLAYVSGDGLRIDTSGAVIKNNIIYEPTGAMASGSLGSHDYNLFFKGAGGVILNGSLYTSSNIGSVEAHGLIADPLFANPTFRSIANSFKLQSSSPAINSGITISSFSTDFEGSSRPQGEAWDRGAFEFGGAAPTPTPVPTATPIPSPTPVPTPLATPTPVPTPLPSGDVTAPTVSITNPTQGGTVNRFTVVTILATATDDTRVQRIDFYVNNSLVCSDLTANYSCAWKVPRKAGRIYTLETRAYDSAGNVGIATVKVQAQ